MTKFTVTFFIRGITCELDFRADTSQDEAAAEIARAIAAGIPGAEYGYMERVGRV
jgi:hypothetical protein